MTLADVGVLACPGCRGRVQFLGGCYGHDIRRGRLRCEVCGRGWPVRDGLPRLVDDAPLGELERLMRMVYDGFAPLHDPSARWLMPLLQRVSEARARDRYMPRLDLGSLRPRDDGQPLRLLEIGVGTGANLPLLERHLPKDLDVELWGLDLSRGMLDQCRQRLSRHVGRPMRLLLADAHALPFRDATFDRVFHVGGIGAYRDPRLGLAEMARVARAETPIVVVDEQFDPGRAHCMPQRLAFRVLTFYDPDPSSPVRLLPEKATQIVDTQLTDFYYCLSFQVPGT